MRKLFILLLLVQSARSATINVGCDFLSISNAVCSTAADGDTVLIASGDCIITNTIVINRGYSFTIKGSGSNSTVLRAATSATYVFQVSSISNNLFTISDMLLVDKSPASTIYVGNNIPGTALKGATRITSCQFTNISNTTVWLGANDSSCLLDHCRFERDVTQAGIPVRFWGNRWRSWTNLNSNPLGTTNCSVVEDCVFINHNTGSPFLEFFDGYDGSQVTIRHSYFDGGIAGLHGYDSGITSMRTLEVYNNIYTNQTTFTFASRGGVFQYYSNNIWCVDNITCGPKLTCYRAANGSYQGSYGYIGYDKTNTYTTNWLSGQTEAIGSTSYIFLTSLSGLNQLGGYVLLGSSLAESLTNLALAINVDPATAGINYSYGTTNRDDVFGRVNRDFAVISQTTNSFILHNIMDGTNASGSITTGYPGAMQCGVLAITPFTNGPIVQVVCGQMSNNVHYANGTSNSAVWQRDFEGQGAYVPNYVTSILIEGRDYTNYALPVGYAPLVYPHPNNTASSGTPLIQVTPVSLDFGTIGRGTTASLNLGVTNIGTGTLTGTASANTPFSITAGGSYSFGAGAGGTVTVQFAPTGAGPTYSDVVTLTGGGDTTAAVTGGVLPPPIRTTSMSGKSITLQGNNVTIK